MKILVVAEGFSRGGLETQIKTYYNNLPEQVEMVFAFSRYTEEVVLENAKIYKDFHFSFSDTVKELCEDVERLVEIINSENIDVIHVHPFYSFFASVFASQLTNTKLIYSYHGRLSFNFLSTPVHNAVFKYAFELNAVAQLHSVSNFGAESFKKMGYKNTVFMPNPIDTEIFKPVSYVKNKKWAIFSRLDEDKISEIITFILERKNYDIESIDIYGSGNETDKLINFIKENDLENVVQYKGYCNNVCDTVKDNYNGIVGIGRLLLEGLTMGIPVFFIGYGKLSGFVNKEMYDKIKVENFSNYNINYVNFTLPEDSEIQAIRDDVRENFSIQTIIKKYISSLNSAESIFLENIKTLYYKIKELSANESTSDLYFASSKNMYDLVQNYIRAYSVDNSINNMFILSDFCYYQQNILQANTNNSLQILQAETQRLQSEINELKAQVTLLQDKETYRFNREQEYYNRRSKRLYIRIGRKIKSLLNKGMK